MGSTCKLSKKQFAFRRHYVTVYVCIHLRFLASESRVQRGQFVSFTEHHFTPMKFCWLRADSFSIKTRLCTIIKLVWWKRVISPTESRDSKIPGDLFQGGGSLCGKFPALSVPSHWLTKSPWSFLMFYKRRTNNQPLGGTLDWTNTHGL